MLLVEKRFFFRKLGLLVMDFGLLSDFSDLFSRYWDFFKFLIILDYMIWVSFVLWDFELVVSYVEIDEK